MELSTAMATCFAWADVTYRIRWSVEEVEQEVEISWENWWKNREKDGDIHSQAARRLSLSGLGMCHVSGLAFCI